MWVGHVGIQGVSARPQRWKATKGSCARLLVPHWQLPSLLSERRPQFLQRKSSGKRLTSMPESDGVTTCMSRLREQVVGEAAVGVRGCPGIGGAGDLAADDVVVDGDEAGIGPVGDLPDAALEVGGLVGEEAEERLREAARDGHRRRPSAAVGVDGSDRHLHLRPRAVTASPRGVSPRRASGPWLRGR